MGVHLWSSAKLYHSILEVTHEKRFLHFFKLSYSAHTIKFTLKSAQFIGVKNICKVVQLSPPPIPESFCHAQNKCMPNVTPHYPLPPVPGNSLIYFLSLWICLFESRCFWFQIITKMIAIQLTQDTDTQTQTRTPLKFDFGSTSPSFPFDTLHSLFHPIPPTMSQGWLICICPSHGTTHPTLSSSIKNRSMLYQCPALVR